MIQESAETKHIELTVVVPITLMAGKLSKLEEWLRSAIKYPIQIVIIHDKRDFATGVELATLVDGLNTRNIEIVEGRYGNPGSARNQGISRAHGKWITFWDSDDSPCVASVMSEIDNAQVATDVIVGGFRVVNEFKGVFSELSRPRNCRDIAMNPGVWRMIFRTTSIKNSRFPALRMAEDQVFLSKIGFAELQIQYTSSELYKYYVGNLTQLTKSKEALNDLPKAITQIGNRESKVSLRQVKFDMFLIARQLVTSLTKGSIKIQFAALTAIFRISKVNKLHVIMYLSQSVFYIFAEKIGRNKNEKK